MRATQRKLGAAIALCALGVTAAEAQLAPPSTGGVVALDFLLQRLGEHRRLLVIGAHPDDEDTRLLALVARQYGAAAGYLSLSRGEGGQNLIGDELGVELGLLRSQELVAARAIDGARQFFTRAFDFGYSRSLEETGRFWPPDSILKDAVRIVRRFRPHVIVSTFSGTAQDRHGQHQLAGVTARAVFAAAGDPMRFPDLAVDEGLHPWQPEKLYRSTRFDSAAATVRLATGQLDPRLGRTYHQIAMESRSQHRSQDMGRLQTIGPAWTGVRLLQDRTARLGGGGMDGAGPAIATDVFAGIHPDTSWIARLADSVRQSLSPVRLAAAVEPLALALPRLQRDTAVGERVPLLAEAIAVAAGLVWDARAADAELVPGAASRVTAEFYNAGPFRVTLREVRVEAPDGWTVTPLVGAEESLAPGERIERSFSVAVPADAVPTEPYFLARPLAGSLYDWTDASPEVRGLPFDGPVLRVAARATVSGADLELGREVTYRTNDQALGEVRQGVRVVPVLDVRLSPERVVWPVDGDSVRTFTVVVTHHGSDTVSGEVVLRAAGWPVPPAQRFRFSASGESRSFAFRVAKPRGVAQDAIRIRAAARADDGRVFAEGVRTVSYPHIRTVARRVPATATVRAASIRLPAVRMVGYVRGAADRVPEALAQVGVPLEILDGRALASVDLSEFDAVVVGSRAYETDSALVRHHERLLEYVRGGGLLLVQYQQYQFVRGGFAPYPLTIGFPHDRITDERSPVVVLQPDHRAVRAPNSIGAADWEGWPQERGLYFANTWDEAYTPLLELKDPDRDPVKGGLLVASYGKGTFIYTGLSFFRALPAGVPGAYRLFLNLLDLHPPAVE